ncbi:MULTISPECIES: DUF805 domain-containing protein [unclassified Acinetobacter]|uniref:DUF805 domain-containing protein n=1 Tax=unclassified Acinetobacter TaxID=196816 RepID=UPI0015D2B97F|nr:MULTISPECIES: DUF805 domain-containing protein [unclassified Acinetobacter]
MTELTSSELNPFQQDQNIQPQIQKADHPLSPEGRFGRLSYLAWLFIISMIYTCLLGISVALGLFAFFNSAERSIEALFNSFLGLSAIALIVVSIVAMFAAMICITIRRLHDLNKNGWLCLIFLIPLVGTIFSIYVMAAKGTEGENKYGIKRPTEQTEKVIGSLYLVLMIVYLLVMIPLMFNMQSMMSNLEQAQLQEEAMMSEGEPEELTDEQLAAYFKQAESEGEELAYEDGESVEISENADSSAEDAAIAAAEASVE